VTALAGIKVLDFTRHQQGPYATSLLADLGADVIKIEPRPDGELGRQSELDRETGFSPYFETYNRGKRSLTLDLRRPEAKEIVRRLVPEMDVLVENFRPGVMDRLGLGYEALRSVNPRLVFASASAFGPVGPLAQRPGFDHIAQAVSGLMIEQGGGPGHEPQPALPGAADQISAIYLAFGIVSALLVRERTGEGQQVDVSLLGSMVAFQGRQITRFLVTGKQGRERFRRSPTYSHYRAADGWVAIAATDPKRWPNLCAALELPELETDPRFAGPWERHGHAEELEAALEARFAERPVTEWLERLIAADVPCGPVNTYTDLVDEPQLAANGYLTTVEHSGLGTIRTAGVPLHFSATPPDPVRPAPELGQHSEAILLDLGYTWPEIEHLRREDVI
jgi:crotonobetainyl-CoA:carnitine CoA-transferase CaiB-like acyl-CoA transferase